MSNFGFGAGNTANNPANTGSSFLFGANKTTAPTTGFGLGSTTTAPGSLFGGTTTQPSGLSFGAPSAPAPGLSFGSLVPQTSAGLSFGGQPSFGGVPASTASTGLFGSSSFGAPAQTTGLSFGQPSSQPGMLSFGATSSGQNSLSLRQPTTSTALSGFGVPSSQAPTVSFGDLAAPTTAVVPLGSGFGASTTQSGFAFGATQPATTQVAGLGFGTPTSTGLGLGFGAPNVTAPVGGLSFGAPGVSTAPTGLGLSSFGTSTAPTSTGLSFGSTATSAATGFQGLGAPTAKPLTLSFGAPTTAATGPGSLLAPTSTQPSTGFGATPGLFGTTATSSGLFGTTTTSMGLFGATAAKPLTLGAPTSGASSLSFGAPAVTAVSTVGLGGIDTSLSKPGQAGSGAGRTDTKAVKENLIPNEIIQTIDGFKSFVKAQKSLSSDIARGSLKPLNKVQEDTEALTKLLAKITAGLQKNRSLADHLKTQTTTAIRNAEMAQRTHDTPPGLQYDNVGPLQYFTELVASFEQEMQSFRQEIEKTEKHIKSLTEPRPLTPQELSLAMKRLHDSFVALAGRLQTVHNSVETQKDQYTNLRKYFLKDTTNVFAESKKLGIGALNRPIMPNRIALGPTPFSPMGSQQGYGLVPTGTTDTTTTYPAGNPLGWNGSPQTGTSLGVGFAMTGGLGTLTGPTTSSLDSQGFTLQKPPPGTKRNKR